MIYSGTHESIPFADEHDSELFKIAPQIGNLRFARDDRILILLNGNASSRSEAPSMGALFDLSAYRLDDRKDCSLTERRSPFPPSGCFTIVRERTRIDGERASFGSSLWLVDTGDDTHAFTEEF
jgi:hypothetical protein